MILALDLASRKCGWCAGRGDAIPVAGAFVLDQHGDDLGAMLVQLEDNLSALINRFQPTLVCFEAPILPTGGRKGDGGAVMGSLLTRRKLMSIPAFLEYLCKKRSIPCAEDSVEAIKKELGGSFSASKEDMVSAALKCGVQLPATQAAGREDAADAFGCWVLALRHTDKALSTRWDRLLYSSRGALL